MKKRALILSGGGARGAYHVGVWKFLQEMDWKPDLICGTSVGSINAAAIASEFTLEDLIKLWKTIERGNVFRISLWKKIVNTILRKGYTPLMDTKPLRELLTDLLDFTLIHRSGIEIVISAVNILTSQLKFFDNEDIGIEHIMASSAIPVVFPWQYIDGEPYWDGGIMANTPISPALERNADEIIVILLSPVGDSRLELPKNRSQAIERMFEHALLGSYEALRVHFAWDSTKRSNGGFFENLLRRTFSLNDVRITTVAPSTMLGFYSILNFSKKQADKLITAGYNDARNQLADFFD